MAVDPDDDEVRGIQNLLASSCNFPSPFPHCLESSTDAPCFETGQGTEFFRLAKAHRALNSVQTRRRGVTPKERSSSGDTKTGFEAGETWPQIRGCAGSESGAGEASSPGKKTEVRSCGGFRARCLYQFGPRASLAFGQSKSVV
jgi:hypothetical protein